jgi:hypothetical protein
MHIVILSDSTTYQRADGLVSKAATRTGTWPVTLLVA